MHKMDDDALSHIAGDQEASNLTETGKIMNANKDFFVNTILAAFPRKDGLVFVILVRRHFQCMF